MAENANKPKILIADDEPSARDLLEILLSVHYDCRSVGSAEEALELLAKEKFDLVISDVRMGGISGLEMLPRAQELAPDTLVIMISGVKDIENAISATRAGAFDFITKPFEIDYIEAVVRRALQFQALQAEKRSAEREVARLAAIVESSSDGIISKDLEGTILTWNKGAERIFGYRAEEAIGRNISLIFPPDRLDEQQQILEQIRRSEPVYHYETMRVRRDGTQFPVSLSVSPLNDAEGNLIGASKIVRDLTEHRHAEARLLKEKTFSSLTIESLPGIFYLFDEQGRFVRWNENLERVSGYSASEIAEMQPADFFDAADRKIIEESVGNVFRKGEGTVAADILSKDGSRIPYFFSGRKIDFDHATCVIGMGVDITERKDAVDALRASEERYRLFIEQSTEGIWRFEIDPPIPVNLPAAQQIEMFYERGYLAECNDAMARQYGYSRAEDVIGRRLSEFLLRSEPTNEAHLRSFFNSGFKLTETETREVDKNGEHKYFVSHLVGIVENDRLARIWGTQRDVTALRLAERSYQEYEEQLRRSQKVEAIGRLAGGVAHDFNNFLAVIMLHVDMLNLQLPAESPLRYRVNEIKSVAGNAAGMVRQLLAFGRKQTLQPHPIVLNHLAQQFMKIMRPLIGADIEVEVELTPELGVCFVDPDQMTQVLMNLAVNARDAMPGGGVLRIKTSNLQIDKNTPKHKSQPPGEYIQLEVSDTGVGMDKETRDRIFEPFFTTKEPNKGTGLGLSTVYGIVKQSNGFIWVETAPERGTTFKIQFPRIDEPPKAVRQEEPVVMPEGSETILLVEDEDQIRRAAVEVLSGLGYQVFEASNGAQAVQLAQIYGNPIHLLVTDVVMPRMNGREVAGKVKALHPETAVLFMSGYSGDIITGDGLLGESLHFLGKPFTPMMLATKVREALGG